MAWVTQRFENNGFVVCLFEDSVNLSLFGHGVSLTPENQPEAHSQAMMLRRAARRLEEVGKVLQ